MNMSTERDHTKRICHLNQPSIFRGYVSFQGGVAVLEKTLPAGHRPHHRNRRRALENRIAHFLGKPFLGMALKWEKLHQNWRPKNG